MPRKAPLVFALILVFTAVGVALYAAAIAPTPDTGVPSAPTATAEPPRPTPPMSGAPRASASVDAALKQLDLIKPTRPRRAEDFTLRTPAGGTFQLSEQRGKVVLVNFWATWCPPCVEEMPAMERLWRRHKDAGFVLIAISLDADPKKVPPFVSDHKIGVPIAVDPKMTVADAYGVRALPSSFVIDRDGMLAGVALGPRAWDAAAANGLVLAMLR